VPGLFAQTIGDFRDGAAFPEEGQKHLAKGIDLAWQGRIVPDVCFRPDGGWNPAQPGQARTDDAADGLLLDGPVPGTVPGPGWRPQALRAGPRNTFGARIQSGSGIATEGRRGGHAATLPPATFP